MRSAKVFASAVTAVVAVSACDRPNAGAGPSADQSPQAICSADGSYNELAKQVADSTWPPETPKSKDTPLRTAEEIRSFVTFDAPAVEKFDRDTGAVACSIDIVATIGAKAQLLQGGGLQTPLPFSLTNQSVKIRTNFTIQPRADNKGTIFSLSNRTDLAALLLQLFFLKNSPDAPLSDDPTPPANDLTEAVDADGNEVEWNAAKPGWEEVPN